MRNPGSSTPICRATREIQGAHRGVVVQADPRPLEEADLGEGIKGVAGVVKRRDAPVAEESPFEFNAPGEEMLSPRHLAGGIERAEGLVGVAAHALIPAGKETERRGQIAQRIAQERDPRPGPRLEGEPPGQRQEKTPRGDELEQFRVRAEPLGLFRADRRHSGIPGWDGSGCRNDPRSSAGRARPVANSSPGRRWYTPPAAA